MRPTAGIVEADLEAENVDQVRLHWRELLRHEGDLPEPKPHA